MGALENANNLSSEEVIEKAAAAGLKEFGFCKESVAKTWRETAVHTEQDICVGAGLNNCDTAHVLWKLVEDNTDAVMEGLAIAGRAINANVLRLYVPKGKMTDALRTAAKNSQVELIEGIVNKKANANGVIHHIETLLALSQIFDGTYVPGAWIAIQKGNETGTLQKVKFGTSLTEIDGISAEGLKAVAFGTKLYTSSVLEGTLEEENQPSNGVITLYPETCCMIDEAVKVLYASGMQSCGKCTFCREGLIQLYTMEEEITKGQGKKEFTAMLKEIGEAMTISTPCSMGQTGSEFVLGTLEHFANEYEEHISKKKCQNNVCSAFMSIYIDPQSCDGCEECTDVCPVDAIEGKAGYIHMIDEFECTKCGKCMEVCEQDAVIQTSGRMPKLPNRLTKCGKFKKR